MKDTERVTLINRATNKPFNSFECKHLDPLEWVAEDNFYKGSHLIIGPTRSGKTTFSSAVIAAVLIKRPETKIILFSNSRGASAGLELVAGILSEQISVVYCVDIDRVAEQFGDIKHRYTRDSTDDYLFYFDDCLSALVDKKNVGFFTEFCSNHRQFSITAMFNMQRLQNTPCVLRDNLSSASVVGEITESTVRLLYDLPCGASTAISCFATFKAFLHSRSRLLKDKDSRLVLVFRKTNICYKYVVPRELLHAA